MNKVVARFTDGRVVKALPAIFPPEKALFHVYVDGMTAAPKAQELNTGNPGFFLVAANPTSNIDRCTVVTSATRNIAFI